MSNSTSIEICTYCGQHFCIECSTASSSSEYCSSNCQEEHENDMKSESSGC